VYWEGNLRGIMTPVLRGGTFCLWGGDFVFEMPVLIEFFFKNYDTQRVPEAYLSGINFNFYCDTQRVLI
jgi:hypothetical protein